MKIVINAVSAKMGGAGTYIDDLARECAKHLEHEFIWYIPEEREMAFRDAPSNFRIVTAPAGSLSFLRRFYWDQVTFRRFVKKIRPDLVYSTGNFAMLFCPAKQVLLVTQTVPFSGIWLRHVYPRKPFLSRIEIRLRRWLICLSAWRADVVITPTQAMLDDLRQFVKVDLRKTIINPFGVYAPAETNAVGERWKPAREGQHPDVIRLCYVSLYSEHKNVSTLLRAISLLNASGSTKFKLKTTADPGWAGAAWTATRKYDLKLAREPGIAEHVEFVGPLSRAQTQDLYRASDILVFPSLTESFGFPMAEAMSYGLPMAAADTPVNREVCGEAAIYFSPLSAEDLAEQVQRVASNAGLRARLAAAGRERAGSRFRWEIHAQHLMDAFVHNDAGI